MKHDNLMPELVDIINRIKAYNLVRKEGVFVYGFIGFEKDPNNKCEECGGECEQPCVEKSAFGGYGYIEDVRNLINMMRDMIEDEERDENDPEWVNF